MKRLIDVHTHTIMSGHAYCTLNEMIAKAKAKGLRVFGVAEHGPAMEGACKDVYFRNLNVIPRQHGEMKLVMGVELNILDFEGNVDLPERILKEIDWRIAGLHSCFKCGSKEENTAALIGAMKNPYIDMISHPVDGTAEVEIETVVLTAKETGTLLELNNNSLMPRRNKPLAHDNFKRMLTFCMQYRVPIIVSSDAHIDIDIANFDLAEKLLAEVNFPDEMVINNYPERFEQRMIMRKSQTW